MPNYVKLAEAGDLPEGASLEVEWEGRVIALFHVGGEIYAMDGICPHQGGPLADGEIAGGWVTCPWHGWRFGLASGCVEHSKKVKQPIFPVKVEADGIYVALDGSAK